jgi:hypothetical protein
VVVTWPLKPSAMSPAANSDAAAQLCRLFAAASVALSQRRAWEPETCELSACRSGPSWPERSAVAIASPMLLTTGRQRRPRSLIRHRRLWPLLSTEEAGDQFAVVRAAPKQPASNRTFRLAAWSIHGAERTQSSAIRGKSTRRGNGSDKPKWLLPTAGGCGHNKMIVRESVTTR